MTLSRRALIRQPSPRLEEGLVTHIDRVPVDFVLACAQWFDYVEAFAAAGWRTIEVSAANDCPDGVFVEDTVVMVGSTAVITNPGAAERRAEIDGTAAAVADLGYRIRRITGGSLDGGDVLKVSASIYVGRSSRTDAAGIAAFRAICEPLGYTVTAVPVSKVLHLKSALTALPDGTIIGHPPLVDDPTFWPHFRAMPEESGSQVVDLGDGRLLIAASAPRSAELIANLGYTPVPVDISEFEKLEACVTCLSVRLRVDPGGG